MSEEPKTTEDMALYFRWAHGVMKQTNGLVAEHGDPHTITITVHFHGHTVSHDIRIFRVEDKDE